ncbi:MAG: DUF3048 domain-containing protein [Actinobacteria bacterium]|nr:DUF3048 domain-containing protein [Actinomycetota bacterium]
MTTTAKIAAIGGAVALLAVGSFFVLRGGAEDIPGLGRVFKAATCPLSGEKPESEALLDRPAVAVKVENAAIAYPLSGLEDAEIVYEEVVEGGVTRFMALYHCVDSDKVGPVRSARIVDPAIMLPATRILAFSGANAPVLDALEKAEVVSVTEADAGEAMRRVERVGLPAEHTLYADTALVRKVGAKQFEDAPSDEQFLFGDLDGASKKAASVEINFSGASIIQYQFAKGGWLRSQGGSPFMDEAGDQIAVDNVLIEEHEVNLSETITDVAGNPSVEIANETGSGRAVLLRDGRAIEGRWSRDSLDEGVSFETKAGDPMIFAPGSIWVHLVPSDKGDVKGSFDYAN